VTQAADGELPTEPVVRRRRMDDALPASPSVTPMRASVETPPRRPQDPIENLLVRSEDDVPVTVLIDELLDELVHQLAKEDAHLLAPMAIRQVKVSPNLRADLAQSIETRLSARLVKGTEIAQVVCTDCRALRSRLEGHDWVVSLGVVRQAELRELAEDIGARTFLDLDLSYVPGPPQAVLTLTARAFRASDARVLFASSIRADETTAEILRTGHKVPSREEQLAELDRKLGGRPYYGVAAIIGAAIIPYQSGAISAGTIGVRLFERFGEEKRHTFGLQAEGFINPNKLMAGMLTALYSWQVMPPNLNKPELYLSWGVGGFIAGNEGNTAIFEAGIDYVMKFRFSLGGSVIYMPPVSYAGGDLGGVGGKARFAFNW
jgi:hypothetical protein